MSGPPPRVWGKRGPIETKDASGRSTPTRVGKTCCFSNNHSVGAVHPHACGENWRSGRLYLARCGPPPRVWGKPICALSLRLTVRSTPTRVGKTAKQGALGWRPSVHPHACGENDTDPLPTAWASGPPPTRVGKTFLHRPQMLDQLVHPHACGENWECTPGERRVVGPPPRVWGKRSRMDALIVAPRSTPTRVGKTSSQPPATPE